MNIKPLLYLSSLLTVMLTPMAVIAGGHHGGGGQMAPMAMRGGARPFVGGGMGQWNGQHWNGQHFVGQHWNGQHWNGQHWNNWNWHHHRHDHDEDVIFINSFGFPFWGWWGYPYWDYPYYYGYYPYGYYPYGYYGYGNGYANDYVDHAKVAELQRRLAHAGYYHGSVDGIFGPRTRYALRAYRHDHGNGGYGTNNGHQYSYPQTTHPVVPTG